MKTPALLLGGLLLLGTGLSGDALAHDYGRGYAKHGHGQYYAPPGHRKAYRKGYGHKHHYKGWKDDYRPRYRHYYRPRHDSDSWYGIHLFLGGH